MLDELYGAVREGHRRDFGDGEVLTARAPGRVNVIGEHTDYNGLPVLPTAIDREIAIAFSASDCPGVTLTNVDQEYTRRQFAVSGAIEPSPKGDWANYAKAAAQALWNWAAENSPDSLPLKGFNGCAGGTIPPGSGLSSSSAMVVAAAFALVEVNGLGIGREELAALLARGERYVGTEGGGMDQAASILSRPGCVLKIDFNPLRAQPVPLPENCVFVIANSMIQANKSGGARVAYNTRVVECRLGVQMLKAVARDRYPVVEAATLLGDVMRSVPAWHDLLNELPNGAVSLSQVSRFCAVDESLLRERCLRLRDGSIFEEPAGGFQVKKRCRHVLTEARRVDLAATAMREGRLADLGRHMNESHESCALDYEVSCPELDVLVVAMRQNGALGARLTGAGFGGCAVAAVERAGANALLEGIRRDYYEGFLAGRGVTVADPQSAAFECVASAGAGIVR